MGSRSKTSMDSFNSRAREGRDPDAEHQAGDVHVSIHAPARGATRSGSGMLRIFAVSIHAPARGATTDLPYRRQDWKVSIHAPARGATETTNRTRRNTMFQFTRPRGARRGATNSDLTLQHVSIHAPARGATVYSTTPAAPDWFQFTRPRGARQIERLSFLCFKVSIHAPARGATQPAGRDRAGGLVSIHAPARGATMVLLTKREYHEFQFTRPRGARQWMMPPIQSIKCFNSRAREGRDGKPKPTNTACLVSIHAPARGATEVWRLAP